MICATAVYQPRLYSSTGELHQIPPSTSPNASDGLVLTDMYISSTSIELQRHLDIKFMTNSLAACQQSSSLYNSESKAWFQLPLGLKVQGFGSATILDMSIY